MLYAAGQYMNLLERALAVTLLPSPDPYFPASNLWDGRPSRPTKHVGNAANPSITADLAAFAPISSGSQTFSVRAGELRTVIASGSPVAVSIQNLTTGKYLASDGVTWQAAATNCLVAAGSLAYQVESLTLCQSPTVKLILTVTNGTNVTDWPRWNAAVVVGHNLDAGLTVEIHSSTDNFSTSDVTEKAGAILQPAFFMTNPVASDKRYARILITGTNSAIPWYGEVVFCYLNTALRAENYGYNLKYQETQIENQGRLGMTFRYNLSPIFRRVAKFSFGHTAASEVEMRQEWMWRGRGGAYPMVVVPADTESVVIFGRLDTSWSVNRLFNAWWTGDQVVSEDPIVAPLA